MTARKPGRDRLNIQPDRYGNSSPLVHSPECVKTQRKVRSPPGSSLQYHAYSCFSPFFMPEMTKPFAMSLVPSSPGSTSITS